MKHKSLKPHSHFAGSSDRRIVDRRILQSYDHTISRSREPARYGFTLLELLIVISIIAILAAAIIPNFVGFDTEARVATTQTNLNTLRTRVTLFRAKEHRYPESLKELTTATYSDLGTQKPYLEKMPAELISSKNGDSTVETRRSNQRLTGDGGWTFITDRAKVVIDIDEPLDGQWGAYEGQIPAEW